jgi:AraC-like DNA-binding protein
MDNSLERIVDLAFNQSLSEFPVFCQMKREIEIMTFMHAHNGFEFHFSYSSVGVARIEDNEYEFVPGKLTIIRPRAFHLIQTTQTAEYRRVILSIEEGYLDALAEQVPIIHELIKSWFPSEEDESVQLLLGSREEAETIQHLLRTVEKELEQRKPHFEFIVKARLMEMFALLSRQGGRVEVDRPVLPEAYRQLMDQVADHISTHFADNLSTVEVAAQFHLSRSYLHKLFKQHTGYSPHQYQMLQRINRAKSLLSDGDEPITDIALNVGFGEMAHFSRCFKEVTGVTPSFYRAQLRS